MKIKYKKIIYRVLFPINAVVWISVFLFYVKAAETDGRLIEYIPFAFGGTIFGLLASLDYWDRFLLWLLRVKI